MTTLFKRRVPFIAQMEATECGAASLGMVLAHYNCHVPLAELREACGVSRDGTSALDIVKAGKVYGLETKAFKGDVPALAEVGKPAILHWELNHFLVLERFDSKGADLVDPAVGRRRVTTEELSRAFTGVVMCPKPGPEFKKREKSGRSLGKYGAAIRAALKPARMMLISALVLEVVGLVQPALTQVIIDFIIRPKQDRWLMPMAVVFALTLLLRALLSLSRERILAGLGARADLELAVDFLRHLVTLPSSFFSQRSVGELSSRMQVLLRVRESATAIMLGGFDFVLIFAYGALLIAYAAKLGLMVLALVAARIIVMLSFQPALRLHATAAQIAGGRTQSALVSAFSDPESHKAFGAAPLLFARWAGAQSEELNASIRGRQASEAPQQIISVLDGLGLALVLWFGGKAVMADEMTVGVLSSFVAVEALLRRPSQGFVNMILELGRLPSKLDRVDDVLDTAPQRHGTFAPEQLIGSIQFENVSFRYGPKSPVILDKVSFEVRPRERLAIVGRSGSGKSTILKLVLGVLLPTEGRVLVDGRPVADYEPAALRRRIGTVLAGGTFFDEPVLENVALGAAQADVDQVRRAADAACIDDVVRALPSGYQTMLRGGARQLSGGQRQRLLLARALVKEPDVLLLDEASSALDRELESRVHSYLDVLECTMLLVAHRPSALRLAERILVLDKGKIVQEGTALSLAKVPGTYADLMAQGGDA